MKDMGLANDPNKVIKIPNFKQEKVRQAKKIVNQEESDEESEEEEVQPVVKKEVVEILEKEAKAPRPRRFMYVFMILNPRVIASMKLVGDSLNKTINVKE